MTAIVILVILAVIVLMVAVSCIGYQKFLNQQAINEAIKSGKAQIYVIPEGVSPVLGK